jgi:hypothetical protein
MRRELLSAGALVAVGIGLAAVQVLTLNQSPDQATAAVLLRSIPMLGMAAAVVYGGAWLLRNGTPGGNTDRVLAWTLGGGITSSAVVVLASVGRPLPLAFLPLAVDALTGGSLVGLLVGVYDAQGRERMERIEGFARKVAALNQYGKALNESHTLDEISALCVEAVEFLVSGDGAAFVVVRDGERDGGTQSAGDGTTQRTDGDGTEQDGTEQDGTEITVVDSTLRGKNEQRVLESIARELSDEDAIEAVRYAETAVDLAEGSPEAALVIPVPTRDGRALIVSMSTTTAIEYDEEDVDLLETLAAHVSTALANVDTSSPVMGGETVPDPAAGNGSGGQPERTTTEDQATADGETTGNE